MYSERETNSPKGFTNYPNSYMYRPTCSVLCLHTQCALYVYRSLNEHVWLKFFDMYIYLYRIFYRLRLVKFTLLVKTKLVISFNPFQLNTTDVHNFGIRSICGYICIDNIYICMQLLCVKWIVLLDSVENFCSVFSFVYSFIFNHNIYSYILFYTKEIIANFEIRFFFFIVDRISF